MQRSRVRWPLNSLLSAGGCASRIAVDPSKHIDLVPGSRPQHRVRADCSGLLAVFAITLLFSYAHPAWPQISADQVKQVRAAVRNQIDTLLVFGGDFSFTGGTFTLTNELVPGQRVDAQAQLRKFGGQGDIGYPRPVNGGYIAWQPHVQGSMGSIDWNNKPQSSLLMGDSTQLKAEAIEFGGGGRFWLSNSVSIAPTLSGLYGHASDTYQARSVFAVENIALLRTLGLVDWHADAWALRPAVEVRYIAHVGGSLITLSIEPTYFHTHLFDYSNPHVAAGGNSGFVASTVDVDVPLAIQLAGRQLRTGGYLMRSDFLGDLRGGLGIEHVTEVHTRVVVDLLDHLWKVRWLGLGASYVWGKGLQGWTGGVDAAFQF